MKTYFIFYSFLVFPICLFGQNFTVKGQIEHLPNASIQLILRDEKQSPILSKTDSKGNFQISGTISEVGRAGIAWGEPMKGIPFLLAPQPILIQTDTALNIKLISYALIDYGKMHQQYQQFENQYLIRFKEMNAKKADASSYNQQDSVAYFAAQINDFAATSLSDLKNSLSSGQYTGLESFIAWEASDLIGWRDQFAFFSDLVNQPFIKGMYKQKIMDYLAHNQLTGKHVSAITLLDQQGKSHSFAALNEKKYVLVDFWASWCGPCISQFPALQELQQQYQDKLEIVSVSIDENKEKWAKAIQKHPNPWIQGLDQHQEKSLKEYFKVGGIPDYILVAPGGKILGTHLNIVSVSALLNKH